MSVPQHKNTDQKKKIFRKEHSSQKSANEGTTQSLSTIPVSGMFLRLFYDAKQQRVCGLQLKMEE
jgi:hypothetical protein